MHARSTSIVNQLKRLGLGIALAVTPALLGQANAQTQSYNLSDLPTSPVYQAPTLSMASSTNTQSSPIIKTIHQYAVDAQGNLNGLIKTQSGSPANLQVYLVANGKVVGQNSTNRAGSFSISGIQPGTYSLFVVGPRQLASQGISVTPLSNTDFKTIELTTVATEYVGIQNLISKSLLPEIAQATQASGNTSQVSAVTSDVDISTKVRIINGSIRGQISSLVSESNAAGVQVHLLKDNQPISQVQTNALGSFVIPDVEPGIYDFVAVGKQGFAALSLEAIGTRSPMTMVSYQQDVPNTVEVPLAEVMPANIEAPQQVEYQPGNEVYMEPSFANASTAPVEYTSESIAYGGAGGGVAGNVGNFSTFNSAGMGRAGGRFGRGFNGGLGSRVGGIGLRRLLTLGAIGGGIVAIADDEPAPASPVGN